MGEEADYRINRMLDRHMNPEKYLRHEQPVFQPKYGFPKRCPICEGVGGFEYSTCSKCNGTGYIGDTPTGSHKNSVCAKGRDEMNITFNVTSPAQAKEGMHSILYGPPKTGKTSTLDDPRFNVLDLDLEGGSAVLDGAENVQRIDVKEESRRMGKHAFEVLALIFKAIEDGQFNEYDLIALDSITEYENIVKDYIATVYAPNRRREIQNKFGAQADWGDLKDLITRNVRYVHSLTKRGEKSVHFMWIAHVGQEKDSATGAVVNTKVQLQGSNTAEVVMSVVDGLFYMYKTQVNKGTEDQPDWQTERGILTRSGGVYNAEVRQSKRRDPLPARIPNPVWSDIYERLGYVRA